MSDKDDVMATVDQWLTSLDAGDLDGMIATCDPEVVTANERQATTIGIQALRDKYAPRIAASLTKSGFDVEHVAVYGDFALVVGAFDVEATDRVSGETSAAAGRLALNYRRHSDGTWKLIFDMDNNP